jgi:peptidyl-tRNA hydrolase
MSPGKLASQAGHAYLGAAVQADPSSRGIPPGLPGVARHEGLSPSQNLEQIMRAVDAAKAAGIPHFLVVDSGCENFFGGQPIVTALGLGPARRAEINHITRKFQLVK